jgi:V8-like Glu-specific endopeptidase
LVAALASLGLLATPASAHPTGISVAASPVRHAREFWTPGRMAGAKPLEVRVRGGFDLGGRSADLLAHGTPGRIPPRAPAAGATASSSFEAVPDPTTPAFRQNGVIFFTVGPFLARCSGTSVNAPNLSVVVTAAHCVKGPGPRGHWYGRNWVFVPGYRFGQRPFGVFSAEWLFVPRGWFTTASENYDVASAVVSRNERGRRLGAVVGGAGIAWNQRPRQTFDVHGYPVEAPFDGETQRVCTQTPYLGHDAASFLSAGPLNLAVDCDVTGGASGGGWTIEGNLLNGVTDYGYTEDPATDFGAYFGREAAKVYGRAASK